jgi:hypothetical protein
MIAIDAKIEIAITDLENPCWHATHDVIRFQGHACRADHRRSRRRIRGLNLAGRWTTSSSLCLPRCDYLNVRVAAAGGQPRQVTSMAVVVATGLAAGGSREILGLDVGDSEDEVFWSGFLTGLKQRGLGGVPGDLRPARRTVPQARWTTPKPRSSRSLLSRAPTGPTSGRPPLEQVN